jgi:hypothetical protein
MGKKKQEAILFGVVISGILITSSLSSISSQVIEEVRAQNMTNQTTTNTIANQTDVDNATTTTTPSPLPPPCCPSDGYIANAGPDQTVLEGTIITLNGSGNNKSNNTGNMVINYLWRQTDGPAIILNGNNTANPTFVAPNYPNNTKYTFALEVFENQVNNNNQTGSAIDTVDIIVNDANIEAKNPGLFQEGDDTTEEQSDQDELQDGDEEEEEEEEEETEEQAEEEEEGNEDE